MGNDIGEGFTFIFNLLILCVIVVVLFIGYGLYHTFIKDHNTIKTKEKPTITWELESKGQTVDTVWIYKFKK